MCIFTIFFIKYYTFNIRFFKKYFNHLIYVVTVHIEIFIPMMNVIIKLSPKVLYSTFVYTIPFVGASTVLDLFCTF